MPKKPTPAIVRLLDRVEIMGPMACWIYPTRNESGYGVIGLPGRGGGTAKAHRLAYEHVVGPIPEGMDLDHLCRVRACCNPAHLAPVDRSTNNLRGLRHSRQENCKQGHPLSGENLRQTDRQRVCRTCERQRSRTYQQKKRAQA